MTTRQRLRPALSLPNILDLPVGGTAEEMPCWRGRGCRVIMDACAGAAPRPDMKCTSCREKPDELRSAVRSARGPRV
jgi:hypothetical protein